MLGRLGAGSFGPTLWIDVNDDAKGGGYRRVEVLTGPGRRRKWSDDEKARIVAETLQPGAVVTEVARRWQVCPQQVFDWRRQMRAGRWRCGGGAGLRADRVGDAGVRCPSRLRRRRSPAPSIEVKLAGAVLRVAPGTDADLLTTVLRAIRASAA